MVTLNLRWLYSSFLFIALVLFSVVAKSDIAYVVEGNTVRVTTEDIGRSRDRGLTLRQKFRVIQGGKSNPKLPKLPVNGPAVNDAVYATGEITSTWSNGKIGRAIVKLAKSGAKILSKIAGIGLLLEAIGWIIGDDGEVTYTPPTEPLEEICNRANNGDYYVFAAYVNNGNLICHLSHKQKAEAAIYNLGPVSQYMPAPEPVNPDTFDISQVPFTPAQIEALIPYLGEPDDVEITDPITVGYAWPTYFPEVEPDVPDQEPLPALPPWYTPFVEPVLPPKPWPTKPDNDPDFDPKPDKEPTPTAVPNEPETEPDIEPSPTTAPTAPPTTTGEPKPDEWPQIRPAPRPSIDPGVEPEPNATPTKRPDTYPHPQPRPGEQPEPHVNPKPVPDIEPTYPPEVEPTKKPATDPGTQPSKRPRTRPSEWPDPATEPEPDAEPTPVPDIDPAKPGQRPGQRPKQKPGQKPRQKPAPNPGQDPSEDPGDDPGQEPNPDPAKQPWSNPGTNPGQNPGPNPNPGRNPGPKPGPKQNPGPIPQPNPQPDPDQVPGTHIEPPGQGDDEPTPTRRRRTRTPKPSCDLCKAKQEILDQNDEFHKWVRKDFNKKDPEFPKPVDKDFTKERKIKVGAAKCPAPRIIHTKLAGKIQISYKPFCDLAHLIRYLVLGAASIMSAYIVLGVLRRG